MAAIITLRGSTLLSDTEGGYEYTPPIMAEVAVAENLPRGRGALVKSLGYQAVEGALSIDFAVADASVAGIFTRIQSACAVNPGTLAVDGHPSVPNCILQQPQAQQQKRIKTAGGSLGYLIRVTFRVVQLRPA